MLTKTTLCHILQPILSAVFLRALRGLLSISILAYCHHHYHCHHFFSAFPCTKPRQALYEESPCPLEAASPSYCSWRSPAHPCLRDPVVVSLPKSVGSGSGRSAHQTLYLAEAFWVIFLHSQHQECSSHIAQQGWQPLLSQSRGCCREPFQQGV